MTVRLADAIINPAVFANYMATDTKTKTELFTSPAVTGNAFIARGLANGGASVSVPSWTDLADNGSDIPTDDPNILGARSKLGSFRMDVRRQQRNKAWGASTLVNDLAGDNPMTRIANSVSRWWRREFQTLLLASLAGVRASNVANNGGDMVLDIAVPAASPVSTPVTDANRASENAFLDALQMMGDARSDLQVVIMHSAIATRLEKLNVIRQSVNVNGMAASNTDVSVLNRKYYGKALVIEDDNVTTELTMDGPAVSRIRYHTIFLGAGAIAYEDIAIPNAVSTDRNESAGNNSGEEQLFTRKAFALHPLGFSWINTGIAGLFPSNAELAASARWARVFPERKQVPIQWLITNG